jgi:hypothetical protein
MPPKKQAKSTTEAAKAPGTPVKTPSTSPAKEVSSPFPARRPSSASPVPPTSASQPSRSAPSPNGKDIRRSQSVADEATPKRPSQSQALQTPERQGSHRHTPSYSKPRSRGVDGAASPSVPPAPATTPVPVSDSTPRRAQNRSESRHEGRRSHSHGSINNNNDTGSTNSSASLSKSAVLSLSASPVPPPPPPTSPVPLPKQRSISQKQQQGTLSAKRDRAASAHDGTPAADKTQPSTESSPATATATAAATRTPQKEKDAQNAEQQKTRLQRPLSRNVRRQRSCHGEGESSPMSHAVEHFIRESKVIAPDVSGVCCLAVHPSEQQVAVARENGSLVLFDVSFFQNIPQFVQRRRTGGQTRRTITSLVYVAVPASTSSVSSAMNGLDPSIPSPTSTRYVLLASMMSGQIVVYDADLLIPVALHQRSGGAIWQLKAVNPSCLYAAMADGSWQQLRLTCQRDGAAPQLELVRVVPGVSGADRALTVATSLSLRMAVGSDDAGNVHAWRLPTSALSADTDEEGASGSASAAPHSRGLAEHKSLWTTKLAKGIALSCAVVGGTQRPCVVVGTSMGDVVLLDAAHGHVFQTFSQHKGPVTTLAVQSDAVVFASGWHESLRSYRCNSEGDWYPAEVKRRTHYHEASQVAVMPHRQLLLSASRDGTILYAPIAQLFHAPAMYVVVTTQQFAYATRRHLLLQSRFDTIEAFCMDGAGRHWVPFFGHRLEGRFHLSGLWCDAQLHYILFSTEERLGLLKVVWRSQAAMSIARIEEVLELPARTGVVDVCWCSSQPTEKSTNQKADYDTDGNGSDDAGHAASSPSSEVGPQMLYVLYDDCIASVTLADGYPVINTAVRVRGKGLLADSLRPYRVFCRPTVDGTQPKQKSSTSSSANASNAAAAVAATASASELVVYGHCGSCRLQLMADGTPDAATLVVDLDDVYELVQEMPVLRTKRKTDDDERRTKKTKSEAATPMSADSAAVPTVLVGLSAVQQRYLTGSSLHSAAAGTVPLPATLPHDVRWIARVTAPSTSSPRYLGWFSRGLLVASGDAWHMVRRMSVEAAFVVREGTEVLVLERNLEKTLEALPLTWKVRRFGN